MRIPRERAAVPPQPVTLEKLLLVEGETPSHFFEAFAKHLGIENQIEIRSFGGVTQLGTYLRALASTSGFKAHVKSLGIIRDAEDDPAAAKNSVNNAIARAQLAPDVTCSIAVIPNDNTPGMIETLCLQSIDQHASLDCIDKMVECLDGKGIPLPATRDKHLVDLYLAAIDMPQKAPGLAAYKGAFPFDHAVFAELKEFLQNL